jgi:hypothetical protein
MPLSRLGVNDARNHPFNITKGYFKTNRTLERALMRSTVPLINLPAYQLCPVTS